MSTTKEKHNRKEKDMRISDDALVNMIVKSYIAVMGVKKWNGLTDQQRHDAIMAIVMGLNKVLTI